MFEDLGKQTSSALQKEFEKLGEELGQMMLNQFQSALSSRQGSIENALEKIVLKQRKQLMKQVQKELERQFSLQLGHGNNLYTMVVEGLLPNIMAKMSGETVGTSTVPSFKPSQKQQFGQLGKVMQQYMGRN